MTDPTPSPVPDLQTPVVLDRWKRGHNGHREVFDAIAADLTSLQARLGGAPPAVTATADEAALRKEHDEAQVMLNFEYIPETGDHGRPYPLTQRLRWYIERARRHLQETQNTREQLALVQRQHLQDLHGPNGLWVRIHQQAEDLANYRQAAAGIKVVVNPTVPAGTVEARDASGKVIGRLIGIGDSPGPFGMGARVAYVGPDHANRGLTFGHLGSVCGETDTVAMRSVYFDGKGRTPYRCVIEQLQPAALAQPCSTCEGKQVVWSAAYASSVTCPACYRPTIKPDAAAFSEAEHRALVIAGSFRALGQLDDKGKEELRGLAERLAAAENRAAALKQAMRSAVAMIDTKERQPHIEQAAAILCTALTEPGK